MSPGEGAYPYGLAGRVRNRLYVSLWGKAEVAVVDTGKWGSSRGGRSQEHPNEMILARGGKVLYVANANRNTVSVFDAEAGKAVETIGTAIDPKAPSGSTPNSLALSPDESALFVANANTNDIAVINVKEPAPARRSGSSPRAGIRPRSASPATGRPSGSPTARGPPPRPIATAQPARPAGRTRPANTSAACSRGTLSTIPMPSPQAMAAYSQDGLRVLPAEETTPWP